MVSEYCLRQYSSRMIDSWPPEMSVNAESRKPFYHTYKIWEEMKHKYSCFWEWYLNPLSHLYLELMIVFVPQKLYSGFASKKTQAQNSCFFFFFFTNPFQFLATSLFLSRYWIFLGIKIPALSFYFLAVLVLE